ncbi:craniofacial development protein 1 isoform X2 [Bufo gargarizans]|uniref:craniofacial development protein 1 isoform X2 n=1 Tax=Bufo gargarizans TaxID=30331 RepID=UPI001CF10D27|nr:craniofacial development protein 1 isoform X2 [Bufo gargarizans]
MSDSEDYSSSDDEDYVPSGGEYSEDDVNELEKEEDGDDEEQEGGGKKESCKNKDKKKNTNSVLARKRKKGVLSLNLEEGPGEKEDKDDSPEEDDTGTFDELKKKKLEEAKKKREEDLWSSFLSDVGKPPKNLPTVPVAQNNQEVEAKKKDVTQSSKEDSERENNSKKLTITKVFDFAGEEVRVTKEVDCSSREAKEFIKQQEKGQLGQSPPPSRTVTAASSGVKRPAGIGSILGTLGSKKQKMSTLEKSKLDWESFKDQEGIVDELARHNRGKDGYIDRKAFLERVDYRQFELEREIRLKNMKP